MRYGFLIAFLMMVGCSGMPTPAKPTSVADSIALSYVTIEGAAHQVSAACWPVTLEPAPGSACDPQGLITSDERDELKGQLQTAKDSVDTARAAWLAGKQAWAQDRLAQADAVLTLVIQALEARQ